MSEGYRDLNLFYRVREGDLVLTDTDVINQSIENILVTRQGSRFFNRGFGASLDALLFEPMSQDIASDIQLAVFQALDAYEPRIKVNYKDIQIIVDIVNALYKINMSYVIIGSPQIGTFSKILERES